MIFVLLKKSVTFSLVLGIIAKVSKTVGVVLKALLTVMSPVIGL